MPEIIKNQIKYDHKFDTAHNRHLLNGTLTVLHCHHFTSLYTQLALDANETDLLRDCASDAFKQMLETYVERYGKPSDSKSLVDLCCQYYSILGLGQMEVLFIGDESGMVALSSSHVDAGWKKKWGAYDKPINYLTAGFIEAMCEMVMDAPARTFLVTETQSIIMGAPTSLFKITRR
jgi:hypothetical protein